MAGGMEVSDEDRVRRGHPAAAGGGAEMSTDHVRENWLWDAIYDAKNAHPESDFDIEQAVDEVADVIVPYIYWRGRMDALEELALEVSNYMGLDFTVAKHFVKAGEEWAKLGQPGGNLWMNSKDEGYVGDADA